MKGKHAVITGGAGSVGLATAKQLVAKGCRVSIIDRRSEANEATRNDLGDMATIYEYDAAKLDQIKTFTKEIIAKESTIDYLVNTVASNPHKLFDELSCEDMTEIVQEGLLSYAYTIRLFWDSLADYASVVNISSVHGTHTKPGNSMYAASKAGVESLTRALAAELREKRVRINAVAPGGFTSEFYVNHYDDWQEKLDKGQIFTPEDMANTVMFLLSDESKAINGETIIADGGVFTVRANSSDW